MPVGRAAGRGGREIEGGNFQEKAEWQE